MRLDTEAIRRPSRQHRAHLDDEPDERGIAVVAIGARRPVYIMRNFIPAAKGDDTGRLLLTQAPPLGELPRLIALNDGHSHDLAKMRSHRNADTSQQSALAAQSAGRASIAPRAGGPAPDRPRPVAGADATAYDARR